MNRDPKVHPKRFSIIKTLSLTVLAVVLGSAVIVFGYLYQGKAQGKSVVLLFERGATLGQVTRQLHEGGIISQPGLFKTIVRLTGGASRVRAGEFKFIPGGRPIDVIQTLYYGDPVVYKVTVPEGWNAREIAKMLGDAKLVDPNRFTQLALSQESAKKYRINSPHLEGYLFPDTYTFSRIDGAERIIDRMVHRFYEVYEKYKKETETRGMTMEKLATMASIVEKETGAPDERPLIASVFWNRMRLNMRLQSDPTTIYGIEHFNGNLTRKDLDTYHPYNTYQISGLPPGPIANAGEASLVAVLKPSRTNYLYFVSNNNGTHSFSSTYQEHSKKVDTLQRRILNQR